MARVGSKRAIPAKTEMRCKLCRHESREQIDQLLLARFLRQVDPVTGQQVTYDFVVDALRGLGVDNPTTENCKVHFAKHVEVVDSEAAEAMDEATEELFAELIAEAPAALTATNVAEWQVKLWMARELARLRSGEGPSITTDQSQVAQRLLIQARSDESTRQLLGGLTGAIGGAMRTLVAKESKALPAPEVVDDAEVVEEPDVA
jgi:hypothetical protein